MFSCQLHFIKFDNMKIAFLLLLTLPAVGQERSVYLDANNRICGPRCANWVLGELGFDSELHEAVHGIVDTKAKQLPSLLELSDYMENKGAFIRLVEFPVSQNLELTCKPGTYVIVHTRGGFFRSALPDAVNNDNGHFVVWLETDAASGTQVIWDGLYGIRHVRSGVFFRKLSGPAVVVSTQAGLLTTGFKVHGKGGVSNLGWELRCFGIVIAFWFVVTIGRAKLK